MRPDASQQQLSHGPGDGRPDQPARSGHRPDPAGLRRGGAEPRLGHWATQADRLFTDNRTLSASASEDLDLAGVLTDAFGATLTFARIKGLVIKAATANTNNVIVGNAASNGFITWCGGATNTVTVRPGGVFALWAPDATAYAVTAGTGDLLHIANSGAGTSVTYDVILIGASA